MTELCSQCTWKQRNQELEQQLAALRQEQNRFLFGRAVIAMMGNREEERLKAREYLIRSGVRFHGNRFVLCAFSDHFTEPGTKDDGAVWESLNSTFYGTLSRFIQEEFQGFPAFLTVNFNGCILGLANLPDSLTNEDCLSCFTARCQKLNEVIPVGYGIHAV